MNAPGAINPSERPPASQPVVPGIRSTRSVSLIVAILLTITAAIAFDPQLVDNALTAGENRAYLLSVAVIAVAGSVWRVRARGYANRDLPNEVAEILVVVSAVALFLVDRVHLVPILFVMVFSAAVVVLTSGEADLATDPAAVRRSWIAGAFAVWLAVASISSLNASAGQALMLVAAFSCGSAIWLAWESRAGSRRIALVALATIVGMEVAIGTAFLNISPFVEATFWLSTFAAIAVVYVVVRRSASK